MMYNQLLSSNIQIYQKLIFANSTIGYHELANLTTKSLETIWAIFYLLTSFIRQNETNLYMNLTEICHQLLHLFLGGFKKNVWISPRPLANFLYRSTTFAFN